MAQQVTPLVRRRKKKNQRAKSLSHVCTWSAKWSFQMQHRQRQQRQQQQLLVQITIMQQLQVWILTVLVYHNRINNNSNHNRNRPSRRSTNFSVTKPSIRKRHRSTHTTQPPSPSLSVCKLHKLFPGFSGVFAGRLMVLFWLPQPAFVLKIAPQQQQHQHYQAAITTAAL